MKLLGLCFMVLAGSGIGCWRVISLQGRVRSLGAVCNLVDWLTKEIRYTAAPLDTLIQRAAQQPSFSDLPIWEQTDSFNAWRSALNRSVKRCNFTDEDARHLCRFVEELGVSDVEGQLTRGAYYATLFAERRQQAQAEAAARGRAECMLWTGGAAVLALLWL